MGEGTENLDSKLEEGSTGTGGAGIRENTGTGTDGTKRERKPRKAEIKKEFLDVANVTDEEVPKPKRKPRKNKKVKKDTATIETIIKAVYGIAAARFGELWNISDTEAKSIAEPLASILERYEKLIMVSNYSDVALLLIALGTVTVPRLFVTLQARKHEGGKQTERPAIASDKPNDGTTSGHVSGNVKNVIPALATEPW